MVQADIVAEAIRAHFPCGQTFNRPLCERRFAHTAISKADRQLGYWACALERGGAMRAKDDLNRSTVDFSSHAKWKLDWTPVKQVLFLCTGNYYRSRFAEQLFNHRAKRLRLCWRATSRALAIERGWANVGPQSPYVQQALQALGIATAEPSRFPQQCTLDDLKASSLVIAVKQAEHKALLLERFLAWQGPVEYWQINDIEDEPSSSALRALEENIAVLLRRLREPGASR